MSISIDAAERELHLLKMAEKNPELILTGLLPNMDIVRFVCHLNVNGEYSKDYLKRCIENIPAFKDLIVEYSYDYIKLYVKRLSPEDLSDRPVRDTDIIAKIWLCNKTYVIINNRLNYYNDYIQKEIKFIPTEMGDFWKKFEDLSFKSRVNKAFKSFKSDKDLFVRVENFFFWLFMKDKTKNIIRKKYDEEIENTNNINEYKKENYEREIKLQNFYKEFAEDHIKATNEKQLRVEGYLNNLGYKRIPEEKYWYDN